MFTGIIQEVGKVTKIEKSPTGLTLFIEIKKIIENKKIGDSIAVNGACLTIVEIKDNNVRFEVIEETLSKTNLKNLEIGNEVNLEPALTLSQGIDGHLVQGHVDCEGIVERFEGQKLTVKFPLNIAECLAFKGSVTINGVSLTISNLQEDTLTVSLIPHTLENTNLKNLTKGNTVNLEVDLIARYLKNMMEKRDNEAKYEFLKERNLI
ncbi:riboflavin synthase [Candidatus Gracilibacteria bacterium]|nr:riboflavin synthase [Candidatus Gracilibacteria bacterium]